MPDTPSDVVTISLEELASDDPVVLRKVEKGYGEQGLGIVAVSGVPDLLVLRQRILLLGSQFAELPEGIRQKYADPLGGLANVGWSHGIESLADGKPDTNKGSFYANPLCDIVTEDPHLQKDFPSYLTPNVWPDADLPGLRPAFQELGRLIIKVGFLLARQCDRLAKSRSPRIEQGKLERVLRDSPNPKGRLLHYYPPAAHGTGGSAWCAEHTDHGSLTGLVSAMYTTGGQEVDNPDPTAGLYIRTQDGGAVKANIPASHIAFQMGQAMQVHSGGVLRATPHFVRTVSGASAAGVARDTLAVFMQPKWSEIMDMPDGANPISVGIGQWQPGISFGEFSELTVRKHCALKATTPAQ